LLPINGARKKRQGERKKHWKKEINIGRKIVTLEERKIERKHRQEH
jgi:hypothetical protein